MSDSVVEHNESSTMGSENVQNRMSSHWSRQFIGEFIEQHTYKCFFIGTPSLIVGSLLYYTPMHNDMMNLVYISMLLIFIGGILIWIPVFYWMTGNDDPNGSLPVCEPVPSPCVPRMKPPDYDSLSHPAPYFREAPPAYDDVFQATNSIDAAEAAAPLQGLRSVMPQSQTGTSRNPQDSDTQPLIS